MPESNDGQNEQGQGPGLQTRPRTVQMPQPNFVASGRQMQYVIRQLVSAARFANYPVLLRAETGSGKQEAAEYIHEVSCSIHNRPGAPFTDINCSGLAPTLLESELFGHEQGAFTDATSKKIGLLEAAHLGTLFLDEIGDASLGLQMRLLKFLDSGELMRVGGNRKISVETRVVAATHRDLHAEVAAGRFRQDLLYRLNAFEVRIPPLRERLDEIKPLVENCINRFNDARRTNFSTEVSAEVEGLLRSYAWPGNVRELFNMVERVIVTRGGTGNLEPSDFILPVSAIHEQSVGMIRIGDDVPMETVEKLHIQGVLHRHGWNKAAAAEVLGIYRPTLYKRIEEYGLVDPRKKSGESDQSEPEGYE